MKSFLIILIAALLVGFGIKLLNAQTIVEEDETFISESEQLIQSLGSHKKSVFEQRVDDFISTSTIDIDTATNIIANKDNTQAITDRLDRIIILLTQIQQKQ